MKHWRISWHWIEFTALLILTIGAFATAAYSQDSACSVVDGDTIRCGQERIRLLAIDAPEVSACPVNRQCAPGDPKASTASLRALMASGPITIERVGNDRYGRTLAVVSAGGRNTSCEQLANGSAVYIPRWDNGGRVKRDCPDLAK